MLAWSMIDLSKAAKVSVSTIRRLEDGTGRPPSDRIAGQVQDVLVAKGVCFLPDEGAGPGVRLGQILSQLR